RTPPPLPTRRSSDLPAYMPPEQARGEIHLIDERADVFGLGAILCQILTGTPPYAGKRGEVQAKAAAAELSEGYARLEASGADAQDRKSTRLNSSHVK